MHFKVNTITRKVSREDTSCQKASTTITGKPLYWISLNVSISFGIWEFSFSTNGSGMTLRHINLKHSGSADHLLLLYHLCLSEFILNLFIIINISIYSCTLCYSTATSCQKTSIPIREAILLALFKCKNIVLNNRNLYFLFGSSRNPGMNQNW
jgi:hypothetical protein